MDADYQLRAILLISFYLSFFLSW